MGIKLNLSNLFRKTTTKVEPKTKEKTKTEKNPTGANEVSVNKTNKTKTDGFERTVTRTYDPNNETDPSSGAPKTPPIESTVYSQDPVTLGDETTPYSDGFYARQEKNQAEKDAKVAANNPYDPGSGETNLGDAARAYTGQKTTSTAEKTKTKKSNIITKAWNGIKNFFGIGKSKNDGESVQQQSTNYSGNASTGYTTSYAANNTKESNTQSQNIFTKAWNGIKNFFGIGKDKTKEADSSNANTTQQTYYTRPGTTLDLTMPTTSSNRSTTSDSSTKENNNKSQNIFTKAWNGIKNFFGIGKNTTKTEKTQTKTTTSATASSISTKENNKQSGITISDAAITQKMVNESNKGNVNYSAQQAANDIANEQLEKIQKNNPDYKVTTEALLNEATGQWEMNNKYEKYMKFSGEIDISNVNNVDATIASEKSRLKNLYGENVQIDFDINDGGTVSYVVRATREDMEGKLGKVERANDVLQQRANDVLQQIYEKSIKDLTNGDTKIQPKDDNYHIEGTETAMENITDTIKKELEERFPGATINVRPCYNGITGEFTFSWTVDGTKQNNTPVKSQQSATEGPTEPEYITKSSKKNLYDLTNGLQTENNTDEIINNLVDSETKRLKNAYGDKAIINVEPDIENGTLNSSVTVSKDNMKEKLGIARIEKTGLSTSLDTEALTAKAKEDMQKLSQQINAANNTKENNNKSQNIFTKAWNGIKNFFGIGKSKDTKNTEQQKSYDQDVPVITIDGDALNSYLTKTGKNLDELTESDFNSISQSQKTSVNYTQMSSSRIPQGMHCSGGGGGGLGTDYIIVGQYIVSLT